MTKPETQTDAYTEKNHYWDTSREQDFEDYLSPEETEQPDTYGEDAVTPTPVEGPCGGLLQTFYGTFSPPDSQGRNQYCVWTLDPQDSRPLRLDLQQLALGSRDRLTVYNREEGKGDIIKIVSLLIQTFIFLFVFYF